MNADQLKKLTTDELDTLAALLDEGHSDRLTAFLKTVGRFHKCTWHSVALIATQCPTATRVAGFQTWRSMGPLPSARARRASPSRRRSSAVGETRLTTTQRACSDFVRRTSSTSRRRTAKPLAEKAVALGDPGSKTEALRVSDCSAASPSKSSTISAARWAPRPAASAAA
jgi:hypothetical protein